MDSSKPGSAKTLSTGPLAKYWWGGPRQPHILFCKTSEGLLLHLPEKHFLKAVLQSPLPTKSFVTFKELTQTIQGKRKEMDKGKNKSNVIILPALKRQRKLPVETLLLLLLQQSEPTPEIRKVIFHLVRSEAGTTTPTSWELAKPNLVWRWYQEVLHTPPPDRLAQLWTHYVGYKKDPNAFVREWYAGFVREYDMRYLVLIYSKYRAQGLTQVMTEPRLHAMLRHLRGRTFGGGSMDSVSVMDYQILELEIEKSEAILKLSLPKFPLRYLLDNTLFYTMLHYGEERWPNVSVQKYKDMLLIEESNKQWMLLNWIGTPTQIWVSTVLKPIQSLSTQAILIIRELPHTTTQLTIKDYAAMIWLNFATMSLLKGDSLEIAFLAGSSQYRIYPIYSSIGGSFRASMTLFQDTLQMYLMKIVKPEASTQDFEADRKGRQNNKIHMIETWVTEATKGLSGKQPIEEEESSSSSSPDSGATTLDDDDDDDDDTDSTLSFWN